MGHAARRLEVSVASMEYLPKSLGEHVGAETSRGHLMASTYICTTRVFIATNICFRHSARSWRAFPGRYDTMYDQNRACEHTNLDAAVKAVFMIVPASMSD